MQVRASKGKYLSIGPDRASKNHARKHFHPYSLTKHDAHKSLMNIEE
jgi:hypothetical protein